MTPEQARKLNRTQLADIIHQLGDRALETDERVLAGALYILSTSVREDAELLAASALAQWAKEYWGIEIEDEDSL